ncbi:unnamed protein product [Rotaria sp. Silwood2]|nr:unnamed protein product [Rotaria sp. Silwood2]
MITPSFIDLEVVAVEIYFFYQDRPLSGADINGTFTLKGGSRIIKFSTKTSGTGTVSLVCPEGYLHIEAKKVVDRNEVKLMQESSINSRDPVNKKEEMNERKPRILTVNQASNLIFNEIQCTGSVAILGDCSGSMSINDNIAKLRRTYAAFWETAKKDGLKSKIAFTVWDTESYFCTKSWLGLSDDGVVKNWITGLQARGGNDTKTAVTDAINTFTSVENIVIICDGDVTPFTFESRKEFRSRYPKITFHFVAVGLGSDFKIMKEMAVIGNSSYTATNI